VEEKLLRLEYPMLRVPRISAVPGFPDSAARSMVVTLMSRLSLGLLIVIPVGVTLVVAWPVILIAAMIVVLSKGTDAWRRPPTSPPRGLTNDFAEGGWRIDRENGLLNGQ
jgi:hypothetical protein